MSDHWQTPLSLLSDLFDAGALLKYDPCPAQGQTWGQLPEMEDYKRLHDGRFDGLAVAWPVDAHIWVNPPYSDNNKLLWIEACINRAASSTSWLLLPSKPQEVWFQRAMAQARQCWFIGKRVRFIDPATGKPGGSPANGSVVFQFGPRLVPLSEGCLKPWGGFIVESKRMVG